MHVPPAPDRSAPPNLAAYEEQYRSFALEVPDPYNPTVDIIDRWAAEAPDDLALVSLDGAGEVAARHSAADLAREAASVARALLELGVRKGDPVFIMLPRVPAWYAAMMGVVRIGAIAMPGTNQLTSKDIGYRISSAGAVAAITDGASGAARVDGIADDVPTLRHRIAWGPGAGEGWLDLDELTAGAQGDLPAEPTRKEDPILLFFTSGTVSYPKMVLHEASYGAGHIPTARFWHDLRPGDRHWTVSDTGWAKAAWGGLYGQFAVRATVVQVALGKPTADGVLGIVSQAGITSFCAPPTLYRLLVQGDFAKHDLSALRHCTSAGEPLNPEVIRAWKDGTGLDVYDGFGQSESTVMCANFRSVPVRPGSMGKPVPGWDVDVFDEEGDRVADDTVGNICVRLTGGRPVGLFREYLGDAGANARSFRHGLYYTGDKAWRDADGYLWFEGRDDDVITSSAYRIGPFEVESALIEHHAVVEAAVVGKDDPERTQIVTAFCVLAPGTEGTPELARELQDFTRNLTAPYKYPREIHFVTELPKTVSGKIRRSELREQLRSGDST